MMLVLAGVALLLGLRILVLAVVQNAADRRVDVGGDLHKIEVGLAGDIKRLGDRHDAQAFATSSYE
jgi:urease beta subunit